MISLLPKKEYALQTGNEFRSSRCFSTKTLILGVFLQIVFIVYAVIHFRQTGRLPAPFFYDAGDTFMDYFNTNFWAFREGRFEDWKSIYPVFVFQFGQWVSASSCAWEDPFLLRSGNLASIIPLFFLYLAGVIVCERVFARRLEWSWKQNHWHRYLMLIFLGFSMPGLYALERGNYVILAFVFLSLFALAGYGWVGALCLALAMNVKQYILILLFVPFLKKDYVFIVKAVLICFLINVVALLQVGEDHYDLLWTNMTDFSASGAQSYLSRIWFPTSFSGWGDFIRFLSDDQRVLSDGLGGTLMGLFAGFRVCQLVLITAVGWMMCQLKNRIDPEYAAFICLLTLMALLGNLGGYALILALPFLPAAFQQRNMRPLIAIFFLLLVPIDFPVPPAFHVPHISNPFGKPVTEIVYLSTGAYFRPILVMAAVCYVFRDLFLEFSHNKKGV
jgi:hypothetical protein